MRVTRVSAIPRPSVRTTPARQSVRPENYVPRLLALRALATQEISTLSKIDPDAIAAWRRGDDGVMRALAQLELKSSGVRLPNGN